MATDNTPPRNALILGIAAASVVTLGALKFVFDSYYHHVMEAEVAAKSLPPEELRAARVADQQKLATGPMPIDRAMQDIAKSREALIKPEQSTDDGPMQGWSKAPRNFVGPTALADAGAAATDAGANAAGDAGATSLATDAGVHNATGGDGGHANTVQHPAPTATDAGAAPKK